MYFELNMHSIGFGV